MKKQNPQKGILGLFLALLIAIPFSLIDAEVMGSTKYKIQSDSVNLGGMDSGSSQYGLKDTLGEIATGESNSDNYFMHAGYWQMQENYLSISNPDDLVLTPIGGLSYQASEGTLSWLVKTDSPSGYELSINATTSPAMQSAFDHFDDYTPAGSVPDYNFISPTDTSYFGFSPEGTDVAPLYLDNDFVCGTGFNETSGKCWDGLSTTPKIIAVSSTSNHPSGSSVIARFRAETGENHVQSAGEYNVIIEVTAVSL
jgi:hypothetical protein